MCEFCTEHGEGKKWYLQMKNYSEILLNEELTSDQKSIAGVNSRPEFIERSFVNFVVPAMGGLVKMDQTDRDTQEASGETISEEQDLKIEDTYQSAERKEEFTRDDIVARRKSEHFGQVVPIEDVEAVFDITSSITRIPCGCRYLSTGKSDKRYCFGLGIDKTGILGKYPDTSSSLEVLEKDEAKEILHKYDEEGLVHSVWSGITPYVMGLCNCDRDCLAYNGHVEGNPSSFFRAEYVCQVDWDMCNGCKACVSQCQFGALHYSSALSKVYIHPSKCFGCGVCRTACSFDAISLFPR